MQNNLWETARETFWSSSQVSLKKSTEDPNIQNQQGSFYSLFNMPFRHKAIMKSSS